LKGTFFNKSSAHLWEQTVLLFLPIFSYSPIGIFNKTKTDSDDFICVALYFFSAGCFVIEISMKKMRKKKKKTYETKPGEVYTHDGSTLKLTVGVPQNRADQVRYLSL
jgi:hypothetical protein